MTAHGTARCPYCGKAKSLTVKRKIRKHWVTANAITLQPGQRVVCGGSGRQV